MCALARDRVPAIELVPEVVERLRSQIAQHTLVTRIAAAVLGHARVRHPKRAQPEPWCNSVRDVRWLASPSSAVSSASPTGTAAGSPANVVCGCSAAELRLRWWKVRLLHKADPLA